MITRFGEHVASNVVRKVTDEEMPLQGKPTLHISYKILFPTNLYSLYSQ